MYHEPSSMTEADRTLEALRRFAIDAGALLRSQYGDNMVGFKDETVAALDGMLAALKALGLCEPARESRLAAGIAAGQRAIDEQRAEAAEVMGALVSSVLERATAAVRDLHGHKLCTLTEGGTKVCRRDFGEPCVCFEVALAVIDVLKRDGTGGTCVAAGTSAFACG